MTNNRYKEIVQKFRATKILVVGDIMLDLYIRGEVDRISPEAPVPVVLEKSREYFLGGAGNVANNIATLGGQVTLMGAVGKDDEGKIIIELCHKSKILPRLVTEAKRPTSHKMRALSGHHQLLRVDREQVGEISGSTEQKVAQLIKRLGNYDLVVVSDYAKGFVIGGVIDALRRRFNSKKIVANIKPSAKTKLYRNILAITLNAKEGCDLTKIDTTTAAGAARAAKKLGKNFQASVVLTRGEHGMTVWDRSIGKLAQIPAVTLNVFDVTGAGDTAIATLALLVASGFLLTKAAEVANRAAGIVVGMRGTAAVHVADLAEILGTL